MHAASLSLSARPALRGRACASRREARTARASARRSAVIVAAGKKKVFIDGEAGTTGLQVRDRLAKRDDIEIISLVGDDRKDAAKRAAFLNEADAAILCLPDDAAVEAVAMVTDANTVIIGRTARSVADGWTYGFPELCARAEGARAWQQAHRQPGVLPHRDDRSHQASRRRGAASARHRARRARRVGILRRRKAVDGHSRRRRRRTLGRVRV